MACYDAIKLEVAATRSGHTMIYGFMRFYVYIMSEWVSVCEPV